MNYAGNKMRSIRYQEAMEAGGPSCDVMVRLGLGLGVVKSRDLAQPRFCNYVLHNIKWCASRDRIRLMTRGARGQYISVPLFVSVYWLRSRDGMVV